MGDFVLLLDLLTCRVLIELKGCIQYEKEVKDKNNYRECDVCVLKKMNESLKKVTNHTAPLCNAFLYT